MQSSFQNNKKPQHRAELIQQVFLNISPLLMILFLYDLTLTKYMISLNMYK